MNRIVRFVPQIIVAVIMMVVAQAGPRSRVLDEDGALALLEQTLKHDGVYAHRISLDCITYGTEETTGAYFQFVLRENHNAKCVGTPKRAPQSIATGFIVSPEKLNGGTGGRQLATIQSSGNQI